MDVTVAAERQTAEDASAPEYWNIRDVQFHCRIGRSTAWRLVREEGFPAPILYGKRCVLWPRAEVVAFLEERREPDHYAAEPRRSNRHAGELPAFSARPVRRRSA
jgi:predicted DNA-binding transcriptional regulator AlpA